MIAFLAILIFFGCDLEKQIEKPAQKITVNTVDIITDILDEYTYVENNQVIIMPECIEELKKNNFSEEAINAIIAYADKVNKDALNGFKIQHNVVSDNVDPVSKACVGKQKISFKWYGWIAYLNSCTASKIADAVTPGMIVTLVKQLFNWPYGTIISSAILVNLVQFLNVERKGTGVKAKFLYITGLLGKWSAQ
jgi:hypothetical protein